MSEKKYTPCGGCGAETPLERCIGCFHPFESTQILKPNYEWLDEAQSESPSEQPVVSQDAHEKEVMMQAFDKVRKIFEGRSWIMEGRGSYPYNDDRYKEEVRYMYNEFDAVVIDTWANIKSKSVDYRKAIIDEYKAAEQPGREVDDLKTFLHWLTRDSFLELISGQWTVKNDEDGTCPFSQERIIEMFKDQ